LKENTMAPTIAFRLARNAVLGLLILGLGTWAGLGVKGAFARARETEALAAVDAREPRALLKVRAWEQARLERGPMPIKQAMADMAARGRTGADPGLSPVRSNDVAPLQGWAMRPHDVAPWMLAEDAGAVGAGAPDASE